MDFEFVVNYNEKNELLRVMYSLQEYKQLIALGIYNQKYFDCIDVDFGGFMHHSFVKKETTQPMFNIVCDILSVDYKALIQDLFLYLAKIERLDYSHYHKINEIISKYSIYLAIPGVILSFIDPYQDFFNSLYCSDNNKIPDDLERLETIAVHFVNINLVQMYIDGLTRFPELQNAERFRLFVYDGFKVNIKPQRESTAESMDYYDFIGYPLWSPEDQEENGIDLLRDFTSAIKKGDSQVYNWADSLDEYMCSIVYQILSRGYTIKKCKNCGKYFVPLNRSDTLYCNRNSPQDNEKTCKEYRKYINYLTKTQNDEATKLYKQIYNSKANRVRANKKKSLENGSGPNIKYIDNLEQFISTAKQWKAEIKSGTKTETEYLNWLRTIKEKKV